MQNRENTSLNQLFRIWLAKYVRRDVVGKDYEALMEGLADVRAGRKFSRDEMNER